MLNAPFFPYWIIGIRYRVLGNELWVPLSPVHTLHTMVVGSRLEMELVAGNLVESSVATSLAQPLSYELSVVPV